MLVFSNYLFDHLMFATTYGRWRWACTSMSPYRKIKQDMTLQKNWVRKGMRIILW